MVIPVQSNSREENPFSIKSFITVSFVEGIKNTAALFTVRVLLER